MKVWVLGVLLLTTLPAAANNRDFEIYNETNGDIGTVYFSTQGLDHWIPSRNSYVASGTRSRLSFNNEGPCEMQMRIHFTNGNDAEWSEGFDFCTISKIEITRDNSGSYHARYQ